MASNNALLNGLNSLPVRYDCFFVTAAFLLRTTVEDVAWRLGLPVPTADYRGASASDIVNALTATGLVFDIWTYDEPEGTGGPITGSATIGIAESRANRQVRMPGRPTPRIVGAAYRRANGEGHVVVCRNPGTPYRRYLDYQAHPSGVDVTREVESSSIFVYFGIDTSASTGQLFLSHQTEIEAMDFEDEPEAMEVGDEPQKEL
ncbi:Heat-labile enterotoxin, A chain [Fusarium austroafricanum]|uniref:Heat-labile enterotoxin, A chain n=1 Tax=Fusarium austroafricanum TaxID=2364996 RepID=A0A8H4K2Z2_9HYPO|nr:Heat-labile enterotoxin, A chain [Fusarium austroafricanum]